MSMPGINVRLDPAILDELMEKSHTNNRSEAIRTAIVNEIKRRKLSKLSKLSKFGHEYLTVEKAAEKLGVSTRTIQRWIEKKRLKAIKPGGGKTSKMWVSKESVDQQLEPNVVYFD